MCKPPGEQCASSSECCQHDCMGAFCGGKPCKADGTACAKDVECCGLQCNGLGYCGPEKCLPQGAQCFSNSDCCAQDCINNLCGGSMCQPDGFVCDAEHFEESNNLSYESGRGI